MLAAAILGLAWATLMPEFKLAAVVGLVLAMWVVASSVVAFKARLSGKQNLMPALRSIPRGFYGMTLGHLGVAVFTVGITLTSLYSIEEDVRLAPGDSYEMGGYRFQFFDGNPRWRTGEDHGTGKTYLLRAAPTHDRSGHRCRFDA